MSVRLHRLSIDNIQDPMARGRLVRAIQTPDDSWARYEIIEEEATRPDMVAVRFYGTVEAVKVVLAAARIDNIIDNPLPVGAQIPLPPAAWLRKRIRELQVSNG